MVNAISAEETAELCHYVGSAKETWGGPDMLEHSRSVPAQAVNNARDVLFAAIGGHVAVCDIMRRHGRIEAAVQPMVQLDMAEADAWRASLGEKKDDLIPAREKGARLVLARGPISRGLSFLLGDLAHQRTPFVGERCRLVQFVSAIAQSPMRRTRAQWIDPRRRASHCVHACRGEEQGSRFASEGLLR